MNLILAFLAASAPAAVQPATAPTAPTAIPDSAATLVPVTLPELRKFADALAQMATQTGITAQQAMVPGKVDSATRDSIARAHGLSLARFTYIADQVRYNEHMQAVVREELVVASNAAS
jgi:hypothetical protein